MVGVGQLLTGELLTGELLTRICPCLKYLGTSIMYFNVNTSWISSLLAT